MNDIPDVRAGPPLLRNVIDRHTSSCPFDAEFAEFCRRMLPGYQNYLSSTVVSEEERRQRLNNIAVVLMDSDNYLGIRMLQDLLKILEQSNGR